MFLRNIASLLSVSVSISLYASAQIAGQGTQISTSLTASECLVVASNTDGAAVTIKTACTNATALNTWVFTEGEGAVGNIQIFGDKCLDVTNGANVDGTKLQIWTCASGNTNQLWLPAGQDSTITWAGQNKCVDLTNGLVTDGNQIQIWDCDAQNGNQRWIYGLTQDVSRSISLKKDPSLCVAASSPVPGSPVVIEDCVTGSPFQTFGQPFLNGPLQLFGLCVAPASQVTDGTKLILTDCTNSNAQNWNTNAGDSLVENLDLPNFCLDLTNGNTTAGNQLQVWDCSVLASTGAFENTNQEWVVSQVIVGQD
ncbi:ricin B lectin domain-containing protein [Mycena sanguinolenta]|nr:ricin B lectin domain-containing protein [Mycena sanguinolenta]